MRYKLFIFLKKLTTFIFLCVLSTIWLIPIILMLTASFMPKDQRGAKYGGLLIDYFSINNYITIFKDNPLIIHFYNSLMITLPTVILVVIISSMCAFALARIKFKYSDLLYFILILTLMLPIPTLIIPIFQLNKTLGLLDNFLGLIFPYTALGVPFAIIIFKGFFEGYPKELEEAAIIDGCNRWQMFLKIMMPASLPVMSVVVIWQFMVSFNEFILALVTIDTKLLKPLILVPIAYQGQYLFAPGPLTAILAVVTVPVIVIYFMAQKYMISGLTAGALKG